MRISQFEQSAVAVAVAKGLQASVMERKSAGGGSDGGGDVLEVKELVAALTQRDNEIKQFAEKATEEIKTLGKVSEETRATLEKISEEGIKMNDRLLELEQKMVRRAGNDDERIKSVGEQFTETEDYKALSSKGRGTARMRLKAVTNITSATTGTGGVGMR